jgi:hypothetical protein
MARQEDTVQIDQQKYTFTQLDPRRAAKVYLWLTGITGSTVARSMAAVEKKAGKGLLDSDVDFQKLGSAIQDALATLDSERTIENVDVLLSSVLHKGEPLSLDSLQFQGKMLHMTKVVQKSVEVNFSDFFDVFRAKFGAKLRGVMTTILDPRTSTGGSGAQSSPEP